MERMFDMSDLGLLRYYLSVEVHQERCQTMATHAAYSRKLLERAGMGECKATSMLMEARCQAGKINPSSLVDATFYRSVIESLRHLVHMRPDITYVVGFLSKFMEAPMEEHLAAVNHLLATSRAHACTSMFLGAAATSS